METILTFVERVGVPAALLIYVLWRIEPRLDALIAAVRDVSDPEKTQVRLTPLFKEQADKIIYDVTHDIRGALGKFVSARRDGHDL